MPAANKSLEVLDHKQLQFLEDIEALLAGACQGHMEKWEYAPPRFKNDPASGAEAWAGLIKNPGRYYPPQGDVDTIRECVNSSGMPEFLKGIRSVVELGPGCETSVRNKTLPVIRAVENIDLYVAIDATVEAADSAADLVGHLSGIATHSQAADFFRGSLKKTWCAPSLFVCWGLVLGNFEGGMGEDPFHKLVGFLRGIARGMEQGDRILFSFDAETSGEKVVAAYSEPLMSAQILSVMHQLAKYDTGNGFDPYVWRHRPTWVEETMQCAHVIYPEVDQVITLQGREYKFKAFEGVVSNNSYKYSPQKMKAAALMAGFKTPDIFQTGSMALLSAEG